MLCLACICVCAYMLELIAHGHLAESDTAAALFSSIQYGIAVPYAPLNIDSVAMFTFEIFLRFIYNFNTSFSK